MATQLPKEMDYLNMSDEDMMKAGRPPEAPVDTAGNPGNEPENEEVATDPAAVAKSDPVEEENNEENEEQDDETGGEENKDQENEDDPDSDDKKDEPTGNESKTPKEESKKADPKTDKSKVDEKTPAGETTDTQKQDSSAGLTPEAQLAKLMAPFKANGRDMQVANVDEAISLMQMGANYNKKMIALKPSLKILKYLENNELLDEGKLSFLVDLHKKDPAAINKLVKDSGINVMELDGEKADSYKRTTASVDDREVELDTVLGDLKDTPTYTKTMKVVGEEWDTQSRQKIAEAPQLLRIINDHMQSGIYDLISTEMQRQLSLGKLDSSVSNIEAYRRIGDAMHAEGRFNHLGHQGKSEQATPPVVVPAKPKKTEDVKLKQQRLAASGTKAGGQSTVAKQFDPLAMSDAEFAKHVNSKYL